MHRIETAMKLPEFQMQILDYIRVETKLRYMGLRMFRLLCQTALKHFHLIQVCQFEAVKLKLSTMGAQFLYF